MQNLLIGMFAVTSEFSDILTKKVKLLKTVTIGRPREAIKTGQLFVWAGQQSQAMTDLFPNSDAATHGWQHMLRGLPDQKVENMHGFKLLPMVMQDYVTVTVAAKLAENEFVDAVGVATDEKEEDRILNSVKALYNTVDPDYDFALPFNKNFDSSRLGVEEQERDFTALEVQRRLAVGKVKNSDFKPGWSNITTDTVDKFLTLIGRKKDKVDPADLLIPTPPAPTPTTASSSSTRNTGKSKSKKAAGPVASTSKLAAVAEEKEDPFDHEDEDEESETGTPVSSRGGKRGLDSEDEDESRKVRKTGSGNTDKKGKGKDTKKIVISDGGEEEEHDQLA
ncbi:hypothetical protein JCM5353_008758 [Sporobolomyces roseus]